MFEFSAIVVERDEIKQKQKAQKEKEFEILILEAYCATSVDGFTTIHGKKGGDFVSLGPINQPLSRNHVEEVISENTRTVRPSSENRFSNEDYTGDLKIHQPKDEVEIKVLRSFSDSHLIGCLLYTSPSPRD